ncbi:hypothetical protein BB558_005204 [Smittium angustum]|uniref:HECT-type E3 ubiquitin transferase n=1 Tax=Smittium angustum TaxID=133377 RepID=A0A2U1J163_SMIAN|nr:hypothetical protein BB558_005204 [Smittium angustum]
MNRDKNSRLTFFLPLKKLGRKNETESKKEQEKAKIWEQDSTFDDYKLHFHPDLKTPSKISVNCICCSSPTSTSKTNTSFQCTKCKTVNYLYQAEPQLPPTQTPPKPEFTIPILQAHLEQYKKSNSVPDSLLNLIQKTFSNPESLSHSFLNSKQISSKESGLDWEKIIDTYKLLTSFPSVAIKAMLEGTLNALIDNRKPLKSRKDIRFLLVILENPLLKYLGTDRTVYQIVKRLVGIIANISERLQNSIILWMCDRKIESLKEKVAIISRFIFISLERYSETPKKRYQKSNTISVSTKRSLPKNNQSPSPLLNKSPPDLKNETSKMPKITSSQSLSQTKLLQESLESNNSPPQSRFITTSDIQKSTFNSQRTNTITSSSNTIETRNRSQSVNTKMILKPSNSNNTFENKNFKDTKQTKLTDTDEYTYAGFSPISANKNLIQGSEQITHNQTSTTNIKISSSNSVNKSLHKSGFGNNEQEVDSWPWKSEKSTNPRLQTLGSDKSSTKGLLIGNAEKTKQNHEFFNKNFDASVPRNNNHITKTPAQKPDTSNHFYQKHNISDTNRFVIENVDFHSNNRNSTPYQLLKYTKNSDLPPLPSNKINNQQEDFLDNQNEDSINSNIVIMNRIPSVPPIPPKPQNYKPRTHIQNYNDEFQLLETTKLQEPEDDFDKSDKNSYHFLSSKNVYQQVPTYSRDPSSKTQHSLENQTSVSRKNKTSFEPIQDITNSPHSEKQFTSFGSPNVITNSPKSVTFKNGKSRRSKDLVYNGSKKMEKHKLQKRYSQLEPKKSRNSADLKLKPEVNSPKLYRDSRILHKSTNIDHKLVGGNGITKTRNIISKPSYNQTRNRSLSWTDSESNPISDYCDIGNSGRTQTTGIALQNYFVGDDGIIYANNNKKPQYSNDWKVLAASKVMNILYIASKLRPQANQISHKRFAIKNIDSFDLKKDYNEWKKLTPNSAINLKNEMLFCNYSFLLSTEAKVKILHSDSARQMNQHVNHAFLEAILRQPQNNTLERASIDFEGSSRYNDNAFDYETPGILTDISTRPTIANTRETISVTDNNTNNSARSSMTNERFKKLNLLLKVRRNCLADDSLKQLSLLQSDLKKPLQIQFVGEDGVDAGGLKKEFFMLLIKELINPMTGMFSVEQDSSNNAMWFNPSSIETSDLYFLTGIVVGLSLYNGMVLDLHFPLAIYKKLLDLSVYDIPAIISKSPTAQVPQATPTSVSLKSSNSTSVINSIFSKPARAKIQLYEMLDDLSEINPQLVRGFKTLLSYYEPDIESVFCLTFEASYNYYGFPVTVPLVPNGHLIYVNHDNKYEYVQRYCHFWLNTGIAKQFEPFRRGFFTVCGGSALGLFLPHELELLIRGSDTPLTLDTLKQITEFIGINADSQLSKMYWDVLESYSEPDLRQFLSFVTGCDRLPSSAHPPIKIKCQRKVCGLIFQLGSLRVQMDQRLMRRVGDGENIRMGLKTGRDRI